MKIWRVTKWLGVTCILLVVVVFIVVPLLLDTQTGRDKLAGILGRALQRDVTIGRLDVGLFYRSVGVGELSIGNAPGFPSEPFLQAGGLDFDASYLDLLDGRVKSRVTGRGLDLRIQRRGGKTNLEGLGGSGESSEGGPAPDLDVTLELEDSRLTIEDLDKGDEVVLEGVGLSLRLTNEKGQSDTGVRIRIRSVARGGLAARDIEIDARQAGDWLQLEKLTAQLPGKGALDGTGKLRLAGGDEWSAKLAASHVGLEDDVLPIVSVIYPFVAKASGQVDGTLDAQFEVAGRGLSWETMKPTLTGTGRVTLTNVALPQASLLGRLGQEVARFAGQNPPTNRLNDAGAQFSLADGWVRFNRLSATSGEARYDLAGRVSLDGKLDLTMDAMPLIERYGGSTHAKIAKYTDKLEFKIGGTTSAWTIGAPDLDKLAAGALEKAAGEELGGLLDKLKGKKK